MSVMNKLFGSAAAFVMIVGGASSAAAFDDVVWSWDKDVTETVTITTNINSDLVPTGLTQIEKLQIQIGDVSASSTVDGVTNNQPAGDGGGVGTFDETFTFDTHLDESAGNMGVNPIDPAGPITQNGVTANFDGGTVDQASGVGALDPTQLTFTVHGTVAVDPTDSFDAVTELPSVTSSATAVGNNQAIVSDVATYVHDAQLLFDVQEDAEFGQEDIVGGIAAVLAGSALAEGDDSGNLHTGLAVGAAILGITGTIEKADVSASSAVSNILNARVDSGATAVGNNVSIEVNDGGLESGDSVLIGDMTQFALADLSATSTVAGVTVNNYTNLGNEAVSPLVGSTATAVGNNVSIRVGNVDTGI